MIINPLTFNLIHSNVINNIHFCREASKLCMAPVFENAATALFFVSCIAYDELQGTMNCLVDSCELFKIIINSRFFAYKSVILFFTKADLLEEKIKHSNIKEYFPEFQGDPRKLEDVQGFLFQMFDDRRRDYSKVQLYHYFIAAGNIRYVFAAVREIISKNNVKSV